MNVTPWFVSALLPLLCWYALMSHYTALTNVQFLLTETTLTAQEREAGQSWEQLRQAAREARLYGPGKANSQLTIFSAVKRRLSAARPEHVTLLATGSLEQRQLVNLALVTAQKRLLLEFIGEVLVAKWNRLEREVTDADARNFLGHKAEQVPEVNAWTPETVQKTRGNLTRFLQDAGLLRERTRGTYDILPQYLTPATAAAVGEIHPYLLPLLENLK